MIKKIYWYLFVYDLNQTAVKPAVRSGVSIKQRLLKDLSVLILFAYALLTFNTAIPVIADAFAHTFFEKEHLAHEHKVHGKNHLQSEISKAEKETGQTKAHSKAATEDFTHILCTVPSITFPVIHEAEKAYAVFRYKGCYAYPSSVYPPPRT